MIVVEIGDEVVRCFSSHRGMVSEKRDVFDRDVAMLQARVEVY